MSTLSIKTMTIKQLDRIAKSTKRLRVEQSPGIGYARVFYTGTSKKYIDLPRQAAFYFIKGWQWAITMESGSAGES